MYSQQHDNEQEDLAAIRRVGEACAGLRGIQAIAAGCVAELQGVLGTELSLFCRSKAGSPEELEILAQQSNSELDSAASELLPLYRRHSTELAAVKIADLASAEHAPAYDTRLGSYLQVPVAGADGERFGTLCFGHREAEHFTARNLLLVDSLVPWLATAMAGADDSLTSPRATASDDWIATVSHDLRNPLQRICMVSEILSEFVGDSQRELVAKLMRATDSMEKLIEDLVDVVAIENDSLHLERFDIRLDNSVKAVCEAKREQATAAQVNLVCEEGGATEPMMMDTRRIEQALAVLVDRAIEVTPAGQSVEVGWQQEDGNRVTVEIRDQRPAIGEEELRNLVERLYPRRNGLGQKPDLGLNIARGIVEAHGGRLDVNVGSEGGVVWSLRWPGA